MAVQHNGFLAARAGDRGGSGEGFQPASIGKPAAVIADLGQHPGTGQVPQAGKDISWSEESSRHRERLAKCMGFVVELVGVRRQ